MLLILVYISCVVLNGINASWYGNGPTTDVPSTPIRLVGGRFPWEGRVEVELDGRWGTICDDMFDINDTKVVCRMLGYNETDGSMEYYPAAYFGPAAGFHDNIVVDDLKCFGEEDDIIECNRTTGRNHNCNHDEDISVNCRADYLKVRLVDGIHHWEGRVELFVNGSWGTICDDSFGVEEAHVICGMLGFSKTGSIAYAGAHFGSGKGSIVYDNLQCHGTEKNISDCPSNGLFQHNCGHHEDAGVACQGPGLSTHRYGSTTFKLVTVGRKGHIPIRLNAAGNKGLLMLKYKGRWGYICSAQNVYHDLYKYGPACRSLGYTSASNVYRYYDSQPAIVTDFDCYSSNYYSSGIDECYGRNLGGNNYCNYKLYIECVLLDSSTTEESFTNPFYSGNSSGSYTNVRLVNGNFNWEGRVEIYYNGAWGTICDDQFDTNEAKVVCAMLGYSRHGSVTAYGNATFGEGYGSIVLDNLNCNGYESDISQCLSNGWKRHNCRHDEDASVSCRYPKSGGNSVTTEQTATVPFKMESTNAKHITVNCQHSSWYVKVHLPPMEQQYSDFKETDIYLGSHSCTGTRSGDYLIFNEDYTTCGTNKIASSNGVIYTNTLVYAVHDPNQPYIVHEYRFRVSVECDMSKQESGENNINNNHGNLEQQTISGVGHFVVQLKFFSDSNFQHEFKGFPPSYMVGQNVYVKATTPIHDYNVKMRLSDCYTKPSKSASDSYIYYLIQNGCPAAPSAFVTTKSTHETRFHFQDFEYAFHPDSMYVHCNATFCQSNDYSRDCEPRCSNRKRVGSIDQDDEPIEGVGPIGYAEDEATVFFFSKRFRGVKCSKETGSRKQGKQAFVHRWSRRCSSGNGCHFGCDVDIFQIKEATKWTV